jgi:hypothetical protein
MAIPSYAVPDTDDGIISKRNNIPLYAELDEDEKPDQGGVLQDILKAGGTAGRAIGYGLGDVINAPIQLGDLITHGAARLLGADASKLPRPAYVDPQAFPMPGVSEQAQQGLDPLARTLATTLATTAEFAPAGFAAAKLGTVGGKELLKKLKDVSFVKNLTGQNIEEATQKFEGSAKNALTDLFGTSKITPRDELQQKTHEALEQMYGTPDYKNMIGKENQTLSQAVKNAHDTNYQIGSDRFNKTLADNNPIVSAEDAHIKPSEGDKLEKAMQMDPLLADKIITTNENPTLRNLHEIQSQMGAMIADKKSVPYSQRDNEAINLLSGLRDKIINNISKHAPDYKADQEFWRKNVIPYYQNSSINKLVREGVQPSNISNILSKPELASQSEGAVNTILRHLTPLQKQQIPLAKLSGSQSNPLIGLSGNINEDNFAKSSQGLTSKNLSQFITPEIKQKLIDLGQDLKDVKLHDAITNNIRDISGKVNPEKLMSNIKWLDSSLVNPLQKTTLQEMLSELEGASENIKNQQLKTEGIRSLLKKSTWIAGILGGIETGRRIL